jgi:methionine-rich copper-binding protein CopC
MERSMRTRLFLLSLLVLPIDGATAYAHAFLDRASPLVGSTVATAPREVTLSFTQSLEPSFSSVEVTDAKGVRVDQGKAQISGSTMRVGLKALSPGTYKVHWRALSVDTHTTQGSFSFHVGSQ